MARNVEIKARIENIDSISRKVASFADGGPVEIIQDDTFFACPKGRLKLRVLSHERGELIFYQRADQAGPKESLYFISPTAAPDSLRETLSLAYGQVGRVRKRRILYLAGRTRIHLDRVEGLGDFIELEVVMKECEALESGAADARKIMRQLNILPEQLVEHAYVDLLARG
jgi:predicted adenylyl cyclase CyaB